MLIRKICVICVLHMQPGIFDFWGNTVDLGEHRCYGFCGLSRIFCLGAEKTLIRRINSVVISKICVICVLLFRLFSAVSSHEFTNK